ncbi:MAG TPA: DUF411 domain-containing protein, partial [Gemmatimonadales bacterium]
AALGTAATLGGATIAASLGTRALGAQARPAQAALPAMTVYKSATCGCCTKWIEHMRSAGFTVVAHDTEDHAGVMGNFGVPFRLGSCHTAQVGSYAIEGHVPADLIRKLLEEHPAIAGLAVPGMVTGSPGMEGPGAEHYNVVAWDRQGKTSVYARR